MGAVDQMGGQYDTMRPCRAGQHGAGQRVCGKEVCREWYEVHHSLTMQG